MENNRYVMAFVSVLNLHIFSLLDINHGSYMDWKTWKIGKLFQVREKSGNFEQTGKVKEFYPKYWKSEGILVSF